MLKHTRSNYPEKMLQYIVERIDTMKVGKLCSKRCRLRVKLRVSKAESPKSTTMGTKLGTRDSPLF